jgi:hypothetical protein
MPASGERKIVGNARLGAVRMRYRKCDDISQHPSRYDVTSSPYDLLAPTLAALRAAMTDQVP